MAHVPPPFSDPGWYADPYSDFLRYWDGSRWTEHLAPRTGKGAASESARTGDWVGGILIAFLMPLLGLIAGIVYATKTDARRTVGFVTLGLSVTMMLVYFTLVTLPSGP